MNINSSGAVRTYFVFLDLTNHIEFRVADLPLMVKDDQVSFDFSIRSRTNSNKIIKIQGAYLLKNRILKYGGKHPGLTQYCEWEKISD